MAYLHVSAQIEDDLEPLASTQNSYSTETNHGSDSSLSNYQGKKVWIIIHRALLTYLSETHGVKTKIVRNFEKAGWLVVTIDFVIISNYYLVYGCHITRLCLQ